jgi:hypothetical protein
MYRRVFWYKFTEVSEERTASGSCDSSVLNTGAGISFQDSACFCVTFHSTINLFYSLLVNRFEYASQDFRSAELVNSVGRWKSGLCNF